jgi:uncharacterized membrane protein YgcG
MKSILNLIIILCVASFLVGCGHHATYNKKTHQTVHVYKKQIHHVNYVINSDNTTDEMDSEELIFWYVFLYNNTYYSYSSDTYIPKTEYARIPWASGSKSPIDEEDDSSAVATTTTGAASGASNKAVEIEENEVENEDLGQAMDESIEANESQISDMVSEGNPNSESSSPPPNTSESSPSSGESSSSGGESSGGSSGGDSGGGGGGE